MSYYTSNSTFFMTSCLTLVDGNLAEKFQTTPHHQYMRVASLQNPVLLGFLACSFSFPHSLSSSDMATSSPDMASEFLTSSETHGCEAKLTDNFVDDIRGAVEFFVSTLNKIAEHHKRCVCF